MLTKEEKDDLQILVENGVITKEDKNLRSKIESLNRNLENLISKRQRLDFEIKKQQKSLTRKRVELKRVSKRNQGKFSVVIENSNLDETARNADLLNFKRIDSKLLQESNSLIGD